MPWVGFARPGGGCEMASLDRKQVPGSATLPQRAHGRARITVVVAVAVRLYREGLVTVLNRHPRMCVEATAGGAVELRAAVSRCLPDVIVLDVSLDDALALTRDVHAEQQQSRILAFAVKE